MLADWFKPASPEDSTASSNASNQGGGAAPGDKGTDSRRQTRRVREEVAVVKDLTPEEVAAQRDAAWRRKLAASAKGGATANPANAVTFDSILRPLNRLLLTEQHAEFFDGMQLQTSRQVQNLMVQSKLGVGGQQNTGWDLTLQSNGFSDVSAVTYSSAGRWSLMHQRVFKSGALGVAQFMAQNTPMGPQGNFVGLCHYPWLPHAASSVQYFKGQHVTLSHAARVLRNFTVGANMMYDMTTKSTSLTYAASLSRKNVNWFGTWAPDKGEWKLATTRHDTETDADLFVMVEMAGKKQQGPASGGGSDLMSSITFGLKKPFIGGATISAIVQGFCRYKGVLELPFGGDREGFNRVTLNYCVQFDSIKGTCKQGIGLSL